MPPRQIDITKFSFFSKPPPFQQNQNKLKIKKLLSQPPPPLLKKIGLIQPQKLSGKKSPPKVGTNQKTSTLAGI